MSENTEAAAVVAVEETPKVVLSPMDALKQVVKNSLYNEGLARGLYESVKALDKGTAHLCILSASCNEPAYKKLVQALCKEHKIALIEVADNKIIGEMVGLVRLRPDGMIAKHIGCSCAVIKQWGVESEARAAVLGYIESGAKFQ
eukprot:TRINITY_DN108927_c0_g1_i1.p2 TRINITY_DN108927_c0_g1~~TRINITY_DN108927_c0_g1_i1.p2  ORF type:complete len:154 (+),score=27.75 TRINITY_DN108927_c0_g1_i1:29-463(+)